MKSKLKSKFTPDRYIVTSDIYGPCHIVKKPEFIDRNKFNFIEWKHINGKYPKTGCFISKPEPGNGKPFTFWLHDYNVKCFEKVLKDAQRAFDFFLGRLKFKKGMRKIRPYMHNVCPEVLYMIKTTDNVYFAVIALNDPYDKKHWERLILTESEIKDLAEVMKEVNRAYTEYWGHTPCLI